MACIERKDVLEWTEYWDGDRAMGLPDVMSDAGVRAWREMVPLGCWVGVGLTRLEMARMRSRACFRL